MGGNSSVFMEPWKYLAGKIHTEKSLMENKRRWHFLEHLLFTPDDTRKGDIDEIGKGQWQHNWLFTWYGLKLTLIVPSSLGTQSKLTQYLHLHMLSIKGTETLRDSKMLREVRLSQITFIFKTINHSVKENLGEQVDHRILELERTLGIIQVTFLISQMRKLKSQKVNWVPQSPDSYLMEELDLNPLLLPLYHTISRFS